MITPYFAVLDKAVGAFLPPFAQRSKGEAIRSFTDAVNDEKHQFSRHQGDYVLYSIGQFDDATGMFVAVEPERVIGALEVKVPDDPFTPETRVSSGDRRPM